MTQNSTFTIRKSGSFTEIFREDAPGMGQIVATIHPQTAAGYDCKQMKANARLIAAAPDMLAALQRARFLLESPVIAHLVNGAGALDEINAAIAKATGREG